ncbi:MAG: hypothetical protein JO147_13965 [Actinobacteria bacterium]|nr:hypothetical protein [Actinomycetota bacterium]
MRWENLFDDLEARAEALEAAQREVEIHDRTRVEVSRVPLIDRLRPAVSALVRMQCEGGAVVRGRLTRVGSDWALVNAEAGREVLVRLAAVVAISGLVRLTAAPRATAAVESRLGVAHVLRGIARDRSAVRLSLVDGSALTGTIDRVGVDFCELAVHAQGELRRAREVQEVVLVGLSGLALVSREVSA